MSCNCKHMQAEIKGGYEVIGEFRELFIKRMTVSGKTRDRRRNDYNMPIFFDRDGKGNYVQCPFCEITTDTPTNYCPECGTDMKKEVKHNDID